MATQPDNTAQQGDTTDDLNNDAGFSLADLAEIDVSDIDEVRFEQLPAGTYDWEVEDTEWEEDTKDGERRFKIGIKFKILECLSSLEPGVDREKLAGKEHTERFFIYPKKPKEDTEKTIGRIRAMITDMGLDSAGKLGDIVRNAKGHTFRAKIVKQKDRNDASITYARLRLEPKR